MRWLATRVACLALRLSTYAAYFTAYPQIRIGNTLLSTMQRAMLRIVRCILSAFQLTMCSLARSTALKHPFLAKEVNILVKTLSCMVWKTLWLPYPSPVHRCVVSEILYWFFFSCLLVFGMQCIAAFHGRSTWCRFQARQRVLRGPRNFGGRRMWNWYRLSSCTLVWWFWSAWTLQIRFALVRLPIDLNRSTRRFPD